MSTNYPGAIDNFGADRTDNTNTIIPAADVNNLRHAVTAMQIELGTNPSGTDATVVARISRMDNDLTTVKNNYATSTNLDIAYRNILKIMLKQTGINAGVNAWSDSIGDTTGLSASSTNYQYNSSDGSISPIAVLNTTDLCTGGTAISGGNSGSNIAVNAFDNNTTTIWESSQTGTSVGYNAYIGYIFPVAKHIKEVKFTTGSNLNFNPYNIAIQRKVNGVWQTVKTSSVIRSGSTINTIELPSSGSSTEWRILALDNPPSGYSWQVAEVEMRENTYPNPATLIWMPQTSSGVIAKAVIEAIENIVSGSIAYYISRDNGVTFAQCTLGTITSISSQPSGTSVVCKAIINGDAGLLAIGYGGEL